MQDMTGSCGKNGFLSTYFSDLEEPRRTSRGNFRHLLSDIVLLTISAVLCGSDDWEAIRLFGQIHTKWLKEHGSFANGIPSKDTIKRLFAALDPVSFNDCFINWVSGISRADEEFVIAIDGKTIRGAHGAGKLPHIVSAFTAGENLCLGQVKVTEKSNEITAIPALLALIDLRNATVTVDAMGCQTEIAKTITDKGGTYILAVKQNQKSLHSGILETIKECDFTDSHTDTDCGHGRVEQRTCYIYDDTSRIAGAEKWNGLKSLAVIDSVQTDKKTGEQTSQRRLYISSCSDSAEKMNRKIRSHWAVENNLHWNLDVVFGEDSSRKRDRNAAENFNMILKIALNILALDKSVKLSKKNKRTLAARKN